MFLYTSNWADNPWYAICASVESIFKDMVLMESCPVSDQTIPQVTPLHNQGNGCKVEGRKALFRHRLSCLNCNGGDGWHNGPSSAAEPNL